MKRILFVILLLLGFQLCRANHITGGEMYYTYIGFSNGQHQYQVTLKLYRDCFSTGAELDASSIIAVFDGGNNSMLTRYEVKQLKVERLNLGFPGPCITGSPRVCYEVGYYQFTVSLDPRPNGYVIAYQRCCRIQGISNILQSDAVGATYSTIIPGYNSGSTAPKNNSAKFAGKDTVAVCGGYPFVYDFSARDADSTDQLRYSFCGAYAGGGQDQGSGPTSSTPDPPSGPPYRILSYRNPYNSNAPLGNNVTINANTGLITGIAPPQGIYVVTVCVEEIRNGRVIATQRKDLQIKSEDCAIATPALDPTYITCDGFLFNFTQPVNPLINTYSWFFGDPASGVLDTSSQQNPTHRFTRAGVYTVKLVVNRGKECSDSATTLVSVFPGFRPDFSSLGACVSKPIQFFDGTSATYGRVNSWKWNFGEGPGAAVQDTTKNPSWQFSTTGIKKITLIVGSSVGCVDTITREVEVIVKPPIKLAFRDTLICLPDTLQLNASGNGVFSWTPGPTIINANTATPTVFPGSTTTYKVHLDQEGCLNDDSVRVRVVTFVTLSSMPDSTICLTDDAQLRLITDGLKFDWTPSATLNDSKIQNPIATPNGTTTYSVTARISGCTADEQITLRTVPYPQVNAGLDTIICYNTPATLRGSHDGSSFLWSPISSLQNITSLNPIARPPRTTTYVLTSYDTKGCPKPGRDSVLVTLLPKIVPFAGRDTLIVAGQPLQLNAEGGVSYVWSPVTGLNNPNIKNPIGTYSTEIDSITYTVQVFNEIGCSDSASVRVVVFKTNPYVFVPTGFTPNGDGKNDVLRPIAVGVQKINYFSVYNRWGQQIFTTTINQAGWDGRVNGTLQGSNVYVWMVSALDYTGKTIFLKGTSTLIR